MKAMAAGALISSLLASLLPAPTAAAQDLNGKWRFEKFAGSAGEFVDVVDTAGTLSMTLIVEGFGLPFSGALSGSTLSMTSTDPLCLGTCSIEATTLPGNDYFDGQLAVQTSLLRILAGRCECFDGNTVDGDGCDAKCRIEPCFTCTGTPSSSTPTPDGGSCSDASACTTGDICTAGVCNGSPVAPCVDLSGTWDVTSMSVFGSLDVVALIEQRENVVLFRNPTTGAPGSFGLIDPSTGDFDLATPSSVPTCMGLSDTLIGSATLDGLTYTASGLSVGGIHACSAGATFTQTATRQLPIQASTLSRFSGLALSLAAIVAWTAREAEA